MNFEPMNRIIILLVITFIAGYVGNKFYVEQIDMLNLSKEEAYIHWGIGLVRDISYVCLCFIAITYSIFIFKTREVTYKSKLNVILSIGFVFVASISSLYMYSGLTEYEPMAGNLIKRKPSLLEDHKHWIKTNSLSEKQQIKISNGIAELVFQDSGIIIDVYNQSGTIINYAPTAIDIKMWRDTLRTDQLMEYTRDAMLGTSILNAVILLLGIIAGLASPSMRRSYNKQFKRN